MQHSAKVFERNDFDSNWDGPVRLLRIIQRKQNFVSQFVCFL